METFEKVSIRRATGYSAEGTLRVHSDALQWSGGEEPDVKIGKEELQGLTWTPLHFGFQLAVTKLDGNVVNFTGLRHEAIERLSQLDVGEIEREEFSTKGQNWGKLEVDGKTVVFSENGAKPIFKIPLPDVAAVQYGKDDVTFEFGGMTDVPDGKDVLVGMSFHIPTENEDFLPTDVALDENDEVPELRDPDRPQKKEFPAKRFFKTVLPHVDAAGKSEMPIGTFDEVTALVPRGRFEVQLHDSYLKMLGQAQDFKIKYNSILHLFILPKPNPFVTVVVMTLDPPIRKGQTFYNHVLFQFDTEAEISLELNLNQQELDAKNSKHGGALKREMTSVAFDVFAACLRGLSGARLTRPRTFANSAKDGSCIRCSYKNDEGFFFPLERAFFYIHKPPLCITHDEIDSIEFQRQGTNVVSASVKTFDLCIRTVQGAEHQFRGIQRTEWQLLFDFIAEKKLPVENVDSARHGPAQHVPSIPLEDMDLDMPRHSIESSDDSDPDFAMNPKEQEDEEQQSDSDTSSGAEMVDEAEISEPEMQEDDGEGDVVSVHQPSAPQAMNEDLLPSTSPKKRAKAKNEHEGEKKKRKKKDKNAPKKNLTSFMFYNQAVRETVRQDNPGIAFGEVAKLIGEKWNALTAEEKTPYEDMAEKDKERYKEEKMRYITSTSATTEAMPDEEAKK